MSDIVQDLKDILNDKNTEITRLRAEVDELRQVFDMRWNADMRAIQRWREAHPGNDLVLPDHADLCVWLLEKLKPYEDEENAPTVCEGATE